MSAYLLILAAILSRIAVLPHLPWLNFTAIGGSLIFFGAKRPLSQAILPVALLAATDYYLTVYAYSYPFHVSAYMITWAWYAAVIVMGRGLLAKHVSVSRVAAATLIAPTSFFLITNFAAWVGAPMYPQTFAGLGMSYVAGLPFYRNDLISTALVTGLVFGLPVLARQLSAPRQTAGV